MMVKAGRVVVLVVIALCVGINLAAAESFEDYYPFQTGNTWDYRIQRATAFNDTFTVLGKEFVNSQWMYQLEQISDDIIYVTNDGNGFRMYGYDGQYFDAPLTLIGPNVNVGDFFVSYAELSAKNSRVDIGTEISGIENVNVSGYSGEALKVTMDVLSSDEEGEVAWTETNWFAKGIGLVKSTTTSNGWDYMLGTNMDLQSSSVAPEPVSSALFLLGGGALGIARSRKKKIA